MVGRVATIKRKREVRGMAIGFFLGGVIFWILRRRDAIVCASDRCASVSRRLRARASTRRKALRYDCDLCNVQTCFIVRCYPGVRSAENKRKNARAARGRAALRACGPLSPLWLLASAIKNYTTIQSRFAISRGSRIGHRIDSGASRSRVAHPPDPV